MTADDTVFVDYASHAEVATMVVCGMTVIERVLRGAAHAGARRAIVRASSSQLPALERLPLAIEIIPVTADAPAGSSVAGHVIAGVAITDEVSRRTAAKALLQTCRRSYDGVGDRYVIRSISLRLSALWCRLGVTPNQITWVNVLIGLAACACAPVGTTAAFQIAGALIFVQVVLDSCDGEVARLRFLSSKFGMWLDNVSDDLIDNLFVAMLAIGIGGIWMPIGIAAACLRTFCAVMIHLDVAGRGRAGDIMSFKWFFDTADEDLADRFETSKPSVLSFVRASGRRDFYTLVWAATCIAGVPIAGLVLGIAISLGYFGLAVAHLVVMRRERR